MTVRPEYIPILCILVDFLTDQLNSISWFTAEDAWRSAQLLTDHVLREEYEKIWEEEGGGEMNSIISDFHYFPDGSPDRGRRLTKFYKSQLRAAECLTKLLVDLKKRGELERSPHAFKIAMEMRERFQQHVKRIDREAALNKSDKVNLARELRITTDESQVPQDSSSSNSLVTSSKSSGDSSLSNVNSDTLQPGSSPALTNDDLEGEDFTTGYIKDNTNWSPSTITRRTNDALREAGFDPDEWKRSDQPPVKVRNLYPNDSKAIAVTGFATRIKPGGWRYRMIKAPK